MVLLSILTFTVLANGATASATDDKATKKTEDSVVTVVAGDTLESIATKYKRTYVELFNANASIINPNAIDVGDIVRIPKETEELPNRYDEFVASQVVYQAQPVTYVYGNYNAPSYVANSATNDYTYRGSSVGNTYYQGYCTWYAKDRRPDLPNMLGNGGQWVNNAAAQGYATGSTPQVGAIAETAGHVTYVEAVNNNGTITISEMNGAAGFGNVGTRTVSANDYRYIY